MVRKFVAAFVAMAIATGSIFAEEVKGVFVKFADGTLTIKVDDKDKEYKIPADLKIKRKNFKTGEEEEVKATESLERMNKGGKFKPTVVLTVDGDKVTSSEVRIQEEGVMQFEIGSRGARRSRRASRRFYCPLPAAPANNQLHTGGDPFSRTRPPCKATPRSSMRSTGP